MTLYITTILAYMHVYLHICTHACKSLIYIQTTHLHVYISFSPTCRLWACQHVKKHRTLGQNTQQVFAYTQGSTLSSYTHDLCSASSCIPSTINHNILIPVMDGLCCRLTSASFINHLINHSCNLTIGRLLWRIANFSFVCAASTGSTVLQWDRKNDEKTCFVYEMRRTV